MSNDWVALAIEAEAVEGILDELDYFQILKIGRDAPLADVKAAYYRESRSFHPDRIHHLADPGLHGRVLRIYKRITEAYSVLRDEVRRAKYLVDVSGPQRAGKLRYDEQSEQERKKAREEELGTTPNGRKLFTAGLAEQQAGRLEAAERSFKMALLYEPSNARFKEKVEEVARERAAKR
ncbi:J domain-containing protein [Vulgatibacter incomptus]|uniref:Heat shock protein DnaJ domain protein n=1 Tax=Vulgatibacter incomptus TaxID=1391653 RepID=A0A0K1PAZ5_9BACT|nr:J domain-containing protein [Vulgatibacter incomptus]AKU90677.1 heat shock protein DnaJ domain protein [Vulgatibacter incomptus]